MLANCRKGLMRDGIKERRLKIERDQLKSVGQLSEFAMNLADIFQIEVDVSYKKEKALVVDIVQRLKSFE